MKKSFKNQIRAAFFAAIIAVLSIISIPTPTGVPLTFQTFAIALSGFILGKSYGLESVLIWLTVGAMGLPVFSGMTGGPGQILGVTGGFLIGFIPMVLLCDIKTSHIKSLLWATTGLLICNIFGITWFSFVAKTDLISSFTVASLPYLLKDIISINLAYTIAILLKKRLNI